MPYADYLTFFLGAFSALFTIVGPISTAFVFISITRSDNKDKKRAMAFKAAFTAAIVLIVFALAGNLILNFFNITVPAFRIAGGFVIAVVGYKMLQSGKEDFKSEQERKEAVAKQDVSIIPLAIPMLSGPGAMTTSIVLMGTTEGFGDMMALILAIIAVCILTYVILRNADRISKYLGANGRLIVDKIMGLIVLVIGTQFIINGMIELVSIAASSGSI